MPRKPTGNPTGRPKGTGPLGQDIQRLTIRLPAALYTRLEAFADGRTFNRGTPDLAKCARQLLEYALDSHHKRQSISVPLPAVHSIRQPESHTIDHGDTLQQPISIPSLSLEEPVQDNGQSESETAVGEGEKRQPENETPALILPAERYLGPLCKRGHEYLNTGQTLRREQNNDCPLCKGARKAAKRGKAASVPT